MLVGLFVVVALITYACTRSSATDDGGAASGAGASPTPEETSQASISPPASPSAASSPSAGAGADDADGDGENGSGGSEDSGDSTDSGDESGGGSADSEEGSGESQGIAAPENAGDPCRPSDVVTTLKTDKSDYDWNDKPRFELTLVNTAEQTCTVDVGRKGLELRITSGEDRVFSTADCAGGSGTDKHKLERGKPYAKTVTWDRGRSWKECRDQQVKAKRPGTYVVKLHSTYDTEAEPRVFRLN